MRYHLFKKFFGKMVKIKETSFLSPKKSSFSASHCMYQINAAQRNSTTNFILMVVYSTRKLSISSSLRILSLCQKVACIMQQAALGT